MGQQKDLSCVRDPDCLTVYGSSAHLRSRRAFLRAFFVALFPHGKVLTFVLAIAVTIPAIHCQWHSGRFEVFGAKEVAMSTGIGEP